ncbi:MAG: T9SS type A sorting domain-containing protein, partial [bacterium]|nr:T9SS type A sorting domain-containing protein [bacterium]
NSRLGADSVKAFTQTSLSLANTPRLMTNMMRWYEDPNGGGKKKDQTNFVKARDDYDRRFIEFYRDTLDATYSTSSAAYTGAEKGYPAGDLNWYPELKAKWLKGEVISAVDYADNTSPKQFALYQNYPNPFNPTTVISFTLENPGQATLTLHNILGQKVATLVDKKLKSGYHQINFDASQLANGMYFYKLESNGKASVRKMLLMK